MIFKPEFIRKATIVTFFCWTVGLFSFLKLFLAEIRPYMFAAAENLDKVETWDCEADFGMPSAHMIVVVAIYYSYKVVFFCSEDQL